MKPCVLILLLAIGCVTRTKLSSEELEWLNPYDPGDTIIFRSNDGRYDTSIIGKRAIFYPEYNPIESHEKFLPQTGVLWYFNKNLEYNPAGARHITITKETPQRTSLSLGYLYSNVIILNLNDATLDKNKLEDMYVFDTYTPKSSNDKPKRIYWSKVRGLVKYISHDNIEWIRIK